MSQTRLDRMIAQAVTFLIESPRGAHGLPEMLAKRWPDAPPLEMVVAMCAAADALEHYFANGGPTRRQAANCWRVAALLAADVHAARCLDHPHATGQDILEYWKTHDPYFLNPDI